MERKSRAQRMAEEAYVLAKANEKVSGVESAFIHELADEWQKLIDSGRPVEAELTLGEIIKEKERLDPIGKWDQEEVEVAILEKRHK